MTSPVSTIAFRTSRAKALPVAIFTPLFLIIFGFLMYPFLETGFFGHGSAYGWTGLIFSIPFFLLVFAEYRALRLVIQPDTLVLSREGWSMTRFGRLSSYQWSDFDEATERFVSTGKSGSDYVKLEARNGGKAVFIPGDKYVQPFSVILDAVQKAQTGHLVDPGAETTPKLFAYVIVPATAIACSLLIGVVAIYAWQINHLL